MHVPVVKLTSVNCEAQFCDATFQVHILHWSTSEAPRREQRAQEFFQVGGAQVTPGFCVEACPMLLERLKVCILDYAAVVFCIAETVEDDANEQIQKGEGNAETEDDEVRVADAAAASVERDAAMMMPTALKAAHVLIVWGVIDTTLGAIRNCMHETCVAHSVSAEQSKSR